MLDMTAGSGGRLDIVISTKAADVSGSLTDKDGKALQGVTVTLWPKTPDLSSPTGGIRTVNTDQNGGFKVNGIIPGSYYLAAWEEVPDAGLATNPDFLEQFRSEAVALDLGESAHQTASPKLVLQDKILAAVAKLP
jgi:hypothetical protein